MDLLEPSRQHRLIREVQEAVGVLEPDVDELKATFSCLVGQEMEEVADDYESARKRVGKAIGAFLIEGSWETDVRQAQNMLFICLGANEQYPTLLRMAYAPVFFIAKQNGEFADMLAHFEEVAGPDIIAEIQGG